MDIERKKNTQMQIQIKLKIMNAYNASVSALQQQIEQKIGVPIESQRLLHKAILLQPNKTISQYGINQGNTIQLVANMLPQEISSPSISTHRQSQVARTQALTQKNLRTKKHRYLQQRITGFNIKTQQSIQVLKQNKLTIDKLLSCLNQNNDRIIQPFNMENRQLYIGDWVDVRDVSGLWVQGQVVSKKHNFVEIHCNGYPDRWNQWIDQISQRIMPLHTHTVQTEQSQYLSPYPNNKPQIKSVRYPQHTLQKIIHQLPQTLNTIRNIFEQLSQDYKIKYPAPKYKYSYNQQQQYQDIAQSFKNNRSHHSPPHSIHQQQQYQYDYQMQYIDNQPVKGIGIGIGMGMGMKRNQKIIQVQSGSIKGNNNNTGLKSNRKIIRSNRYIDNKNLHLSYSKTKSQHQHKLHRQQTPNKNINKNSNNNISTNLNNNNNTNSNVNNNNDGNSNNSNSNANSNNNNNNSNSNNSNNNNINNKDMIDMIDQNIQHNQLNPLLILALTKQQQIQQNQQKIIQDMQQIELQQTQIPKIQNIIQFSNQYSQPILPSNIVKQSISLQADNMSNKCQQNMSNKGQHDDGQSSAKSFGSKRSDRFLDASSMKSLNIDTLHNDSQHVKDQKNAHTKNAKKNLLVFDNSQAHSVRSAVQNQDNQGRSNYYFNQQGILEEEDSQINQQINQEYYLQKKKQSFKKLRATQLAPLCDRLGRMLVDLAPHLANLGYKQSISSTNFSQNLSTFTNQGSLQSRFKNFNQINQEDQQEKSSHQSNKYCNFQIPIMLTPWEIMKINKFLAEENRQTQ